MTAYRPIVRRNAARRGGRTHSSRVLKPTVSTGSSKPIMRTSVARAVTSACTAARFAVGRRNSRVSVYAPTANRFMNTRSL
jgi:hypothetical protein